MVVHWTHQAQLEYVWGGKYGSANCNPCSGGMVGEIHSNGAKRFTGAQIRASSDEPVPDPKSPGLNHSQVRASLFRLSKGTIDLDVRNGYQFASLKVRLLDGAPAQVGIRRSVLVNAGLGFGQTFGGGHDITVFVIDGELWFDDPLTGRHRIPWDVLQSACGALVINADGDIAGYGKVWASFGRDVTKDYQVTIRPQPGDTRRSWVEYIVVSGRIRSHIWHKPGTAGFQAACTPPSAILTESGKARVSLVRITQGGYKDRWVSAVWSDET